MRITATVTIDVADKFAELGGADLVRRLVTANLSLSQRNFPDMIEGYSVTVERPESDGDEIADTPAPEFPNRYVVGSVKPTRAAQDARKGYPFPNRRSNAPEDTPPKGGPTGRTGRPLTLRDHHASDGGPVRESGPRSPEELTKQGITVWKDGYGPRDFNPPPRQPAQQEAPKTASKGQRAAPVQNKVTVKRRGNTK